MTFPRVFVTSNITFLAFSHDRGSIRVRSFRVANCQNIKSTRFRIVAGRKMQINKTTITRMICIGGVVDLHTRTEAHTTNRKYLHKLATRCFSKCNFIFLIIIALRCIIQMQRPCKFLLVEMIIRENLLLDTHASY